MAGPHIYFSVSSGPSGGRAAVYRADSQGGSIGRCEDGLPEWFSTNVNTACLAASGDDALIGDQNGTVYGSADAGASWRVIAEGLPRLTCLALG